MAQDSNIWKQAYESYKIYNPTSKHNTKHQPAKRKPVLEKEPMQLLEEYRSILEQIKVLTKRRQTIRNQMRKHGQDPVNFTRSTYFDRPILLYALELENNCYYIGMSRNVDRRFKAHQKGKTIWTKENSPIKILEVRETGLTSDSEAAQLEDEMTLEYAKQYGIDKVRGGGYCQRKPVWPKDLLEPDLSWIQ